MGRATRVSGIRDACRCVVLAVLLTVTLAASAHAAPTSITEYPVDVGHATNLEHLLVAPDGTVWFSDGYWPEGSFHALIGRIDPEGQVEEFDEGLGSHSSIRDLVAAPDGNVWFADGGYYLGGSAIGKITPDGTITEYGGGLGASRPARITVGPEGDLWFTATGESPAIGRATLGGSIGAYDLPGRPLDAVGGPDGNVWFTYGGEGIEPAIGRVERHEDGSAVITLFRTGLDAHSKPVRIAAADGYLWFSDRGEGEPAIGRVSTSGQITEFRAGLATESSIWELAPGPEGDVWFADDGAGAVGRITPSGQISEFTDESLRPNWGLRYITAGPDGNMWFTYSGGQAGVGKVSPSGEITIFHEGHEGLAFTSSPAEIAAGPAGELWFISSTGPTSQVLGRIVPGDDNPPNAPASTAPGPTKITLPGRVVVIGGRTLKFDRHGLVRIRLFCQSLATACDGTLQLTIFVPEASGPRKVGSVSFSLAPGASRTISLRLDRLGRDLLATKHHRRAELSIVPLSNVTMEPLRLSITSPRRRGKDHRRR